MMKLSIIVPIYNVRPWLSRCLASCLQQGLKPDEYEIVAVNDGSTDDSMQVLEAFRADAEKQSLPMPSWTVVDQLNQGLSAARNAGLKAAQGDYVWWIDSDDFVEPDSASALLRRAYADRLDVLCFGLNLYTEGEVPLIERFPISDTSHGRVLTGTQFMMQVGMPPAAWAALYRREFLLAQNLTFLEGALHEDQDFTPRAYLLAQRIAFEDRAVYNYVQREGSIMNSLNPKKTTDLLLICDRLWTFAQQHTEAGTPVRNIFLNRISFLFSQALSNLCRCGIFDFPGDCKKLPYYPLSINKQLSQKERYKYRLINVSVPLYMKLYRKFNAPGHYKSRRLRTH